MKRVLIIACALAPLLAGCASSMQVRTADPRLPAAFEGPPAPAAADEHVIDRWWTLYDDPQLQTLVDQALAGSFDQQAALARLEQAYFQRRVTRAGLLPQGNLSGSGARSSTSILGGGTSTYIDPVTGSTGTTTYLTPGSSVDLSASFNVSWEADVFGRSRQGRRIANAEYLSAQYDYDATRTLIASNVAQSLFQARGYAMQLADAQESVRINRELEHIVRLRVTHGLAAGSDLDQATSNTGQAQAQVENYQAQLDTARRSLLLLVGRGIDPLASLPVPASVGTPPPAPAIVPARLLERRPDVKQAEVAIRSQLGQFRLAKLALFPTLNLQPGVTVAQTLGDYNYSSLIWNLGVGLTVPVLDRPKLLAQIGIQKAITEQAVVAYEQAVQTAYADTENALVLLDSDRRRAETLHVAEAQAEAAYRKIQKGYVLGLIDLQPALVAETTWRNLRIQRTAADVTVMSRSVQLFKAIGGGWTPDAPAATAPNFAQRGAS